MMNVDFEKLFKLLLPTFMRGGLNELLKSIAFAFTSLYASFLEWKTDMRLQAAITCQVMYLELILNYRLLGTFNRTITISDGDGVESDFVINQPKGVEVDSYRLVALIDKYKTYGKRYSIQQRQYSYEVLWGDSICEKVEKTYQVLWGDFVCETTLNNLIDNHIRIITGASDFNAVSEYPVASDVIINVYAAPYQGNVGEYHLIIAAGDRSAIPIGFEGGFDTLDYISHGPVIDSEYNYIFSGII